MVWSMSIPSSWGTLFTSDPGLKGGSDYKSSLENPSNKCHFKNNLFHSAYVIFRFLALSGKFQSSFFQPLLKTPLHTIILNDIREKRDAQYEEGGILFLKQADLLEKLGSVETSTEVQTSWAL